MSDKQPAEILALLEAACAELTEMCSRQWRGDAAIKWAIPARPGVDSDLIIGDALQEARDYFRKLT